jgi:hypothetical protein
MLKKMACVLMAATLLCAMATASRAGPHGCYSNHCGKH